MSTKSRLKIKKKSDSCKRVLKRIARHFFEHNVGKNAAALAYYLLFALFPILIFVSNLLGVLDLNVSAITQTLNRILPHDVVGIIENYLDHISDNSSHVLMWFALVFSVWFPMRAVKGLMDDVRRAYGLDRPERLLNYTVKQLVYTVVFLVVIGLTLLLSILGENVLNYILSLLPEGTIRISAYLFDLWQYLRFLPAALLMSVAIGTLYYISLDRRPPIKTLLPGIAGALLSWLVVSVGFSFYVENFAHYSVIYGTLGAVIVLLIWLYMTAIVLILGAELNAVLLQEKRL